MVQINDSEFIRSESFENTDIDITAWTGSTARELSWEVYWGDAKSQIKTMPRKSIDCIVTSPPYYWLRHYQVDGQIGLEDTVGEYVRALCGVMDEAYRVLRTDGLLFLNLADTFYSGKGEPTSADNKNRKRRIGLRAVDKGGGLGIKLRGKTSIGVPWRVAIAMMRRRWILRSAIIWNREKSLPEAVNDRPHKRYETIFMFSKARSYYFDRTPLIDNHEEDVWTISDRPLSANHLATAPFPDALVERCLAIGCKPGGKVLDPFAGSGTTLRVALANGHPVAGIDLNRDCCLHMVSQINKDF